MASCENQSIWASLTTCEFLEIVLGVVVDVPVVKALVMVELVVRAEMKDENKTLKFFLLSIQHATR